MFALLGGVLFALLLNIFPQHTILAEDPVGPGNDCYWGFAQVEKNWLNWNNDGFTKLCDCTATGYIIVGDHTPCPQPE